MFSKNEDWYNSLIAKANKIINIERSSNINIKQYILEFTKKNECFISNIDFLLNDADIHLVDLEIYTLDVHNIAKLLFKELCKKFGTGFLLKINLINKHYSIEYNVRTLCNIHYIKQYQNFSLKDFISPNIIQNQMVLPPIIELIDIYKKLYNPEYAKDWLKLLEQSKKLQLLVESQISQFMKLKCPSCSSTKKCDKCHQSRNLEITQILKLINIFLDDNTDYIRLMETPDLISIISCNNIEIDFFRIHKYLSKEIKNGIIYKKKNLFICKDLRIEKYTFYLNISKHGNDWNLVKKPFLDIYINGTYELVPHIKYVADPIVKLRFKYISIMNILAAQKIHNLSIKLSQDTIKKYLDDILIIQKQVDLYNKKEFIGIYINELYSFKKELQEVKIKNSRIYCANI